MNKGDIIQRQYGVRMVQGVVVMDGEMEIRRADGEYRYIYGTCRGDSLFFSVCRESLFDALEEREVSTIFGMAMPPYDLMVEDFPKEEQYTSLEEGGASFYYECLVMLKDSLEAKRMAQYDDEEDDEGYDEDEPANGLYNRPDLFLYEEEEYPFEPSNDEKLPF